MTAASGNAFLVVRLASDRSVYRPKPYVLGTVEIRPGEFDSPREAKALTDSSDLFGLRLDLRIAPRLATIVENLSQSAAEEEALTRFEGVLDLLDASNPGLSEFQLTSAGFLRDLRNGTIYPRTPASIGTTGLLPTPSFRRVSEQFPRIDFTEFLAEHSGSELVQRFLRSIHWVRKSRWEADRQLKTLHRWFAMEAAIKRDKNHDIVPEILIALGFPRGKSEMLLSSTLRSSLNSHPRYRVWSKELLKRLEKMRDWRNNTVHSGFRPWDLPRVELEEYSHLSILACARVQRLLSVAIGQGWETLAALESNYIPLLELNTALVNDVHGTVIYSLEHPN